MTNYNNYTGSSSTTGQGNSPTENEIILNSLSFLLSKAVLTPMAAIEAAYKLGKSSSAKNA